MATQWTCPYCRQHQVITFSGTGRNADIEHYSPNIGLSSFGVRIGTSTVAIRCLNADCNKITLVVTLSQYQHNGSEFIPIEEPLYRWPLLPESSAKVHPDYIPEPLRIDYLEACRIRDLSPKASATLARRCIQGMIRDFAKISRKTLNGEIDALRKAVDDNTAPQGVLHESIEALDHVRNIGNIGAHMEVDINHIIEVDPGEAQALIELIELLFEEWYVARENRKLRLARVADIAAEKKQIKSERPRTLPGPEGNSE